MEMKSFDLHAECGPDVTVLRVEIREQALSVLHRFYGHEYMKGPRKLGKHDFITFTAIDRNHRPFSFVAEKMKIWTRCGGMPSHIHIVPLSEHSSAALPSRSRFVWELHNHWIVSTTELNTILTSTGHHYNLFSANCWSYATNTVENVLGLWLCHSLRMHDFKAVRGCMEALEQLEIVKRPLPGDVFRLFFRVGRAVIRSEDLDTLRRIANSCNRRSVKLASSCARSCDTNCDTVEVVLYLCLRHSLSMLDLELARGCEEALQQLETATRSLLRRHVYKPLSHKNSDTMRKIYNWCSRRSVELASSCAGNSATNCGNAEAVMYLRLGYSLRKHDIELARDCEEALQQLGTVKRTMLLDYLRLVYKLLSPPDLDPLRMIDNWWNRRSVKSATSCAINCDAVEAVLYLCLRHSLRMHDLELARRCEEALQQLETVKRPLPRKVLRLVYKPQNPDTLRRIGNWWNRLSVKLASSYPKNCDPNVHRVIAV